MFTQHQKKKEHQSAPVLTQDNERGRECKDNTEERKERKKEEERRKDHTCSERKARNKIARERNTVREGHATKRMSSSKSQMHVPWE